MARSLGPAKRGEGETKNPLVRSPDEADASTGSLFRAMRCDFGGGRVGMRRRGQAGRKSTGEGCAIARMSLLQEIGSRVALRETLLELRISRVRRQSAWPGNFKRTAWLTRGSFRVAGALPRNLSSIKISAPSGSEETVTVPTPSGADDEEIFDESEDSAPSLARGWPAV